jgi:hypothetical protein
VPPSTQQQQVAGFTTKDNALIKGSVIILDIKSLNPADQSYGSLSDCAQLCTQTPGCDSWAVCVDSKGCGTGCQQYNKVHPRCECRAC